MVPPKGPVFARSTSTWIHWWSSVASANASTRFWVTSNQSVVPISSPTAASSSARSVKVRTWSLSVFDRMTTMSAVLTEPSAGPPVTREQAQRAPKVLLHDHLDGGLRPATIVELAAEVGHALPADDAESLGQWFRESADSGSLVRYLETFDHTVAVMQRADHLTRVARECVEDLAADGVVYAEVRYAPEQHLQGGLTLEEVVSAVQAGFDEGMAAARRPKGTGIVVKQLL